MTIAYCWLDRSLSMERITAVADSRISQQLTDRSWVQMQNETIKLFRVPVRCYSMESFDCPTGTWRTPYFETELGLAFAGDCTEALSIANSFMRAVSQLVVDGSTRPNPEPIKLYHMLKCVFRPNVTAHFGIVTGHFGHRDRHPISAHRDRPFRHRDRPFRRS
jgi:hypothetical protein